MPFWVYILRSESTGKIYIGHTSDLERRLQEHNNNQVGRKRFTRKQGGPWYLLYAEEVPTRTEALMREKYLKSGKGREWFKQNAPESQLRLKNTLVAD